MINTSFPNWFESSVTVVSLLESIRSDSSILLLLSIVFLSSGRVSIADFDCVLTVFVFAATKKNSIMYCNLWFPSLRLRFPRIPVHHIAAVIKRSQCKPNGAVSKRPVDDTVTLCRYLYDGLCFLTLVRQNKFELKEFLEQWVRRNLYNIKSQEYRKSQLKQNWWREIEGILKKTWFWICW